MQQQRLRLKPETVELASALATALGMTNPRQAVEYALYLLQERVTMSAPLPTAAPPKKPPTPPKNKPNKPKSVAAQMFEDI